MVVGRFVVDNVTKTGFDNHLSPDDGGTNMFIELAVVPVYDVLPTDPDALQAAIAAEADLWAEVQRSQGFGIPDGELLFGNPFDMVRRFAPHDRSPDGKSTQGRGDHKALLERSFQAGAFTSFLPGPKESSTETIIIEDAKRRQLFSFAVASFLELPDPELAEWMLSTTDTTARLQLCTELLSSKRKCWQDTAKRAMGW